MNKQQLEKTVDANWEKLYKQGPEDWGKTIYNGWNDWRHRSSGVPREVEDRSIECGCCKGEGKIRGSRR